MNISLLDHNVFVIFPCMVDKSRLFFFSNVISGVGWPLLLATQCVIRLPNKANHGYVSAAGLDLKAQPRDQTDKYKV